MKTLPCTAIALACLLALPWPCAAADQASPASANPAAPSTPQGLTPEQQEKIRQVVGFSRPEGTAAGGPPGAQFSKESSDKAAAPAKPEQKRTTKPIYGDIIIHK